MQNYLVNGVPLFTPGQEQAAGRGWLRTDDALAAVGSLRDITRWAEEVFGVGLRSGLLDALLLMRGGRAPLPLRALADALGGGADDVLPLVKALQQRGLVALRDGGDGDGVHVEPTGRLALAFEQFGELVDRTFVSRTALRRALLLCTLADPALEALVQRIFDRFFDLGWLYLHNWAGLCTMMATLLTEALKLEGLDARVQIGPLSIERDGRSFGLGMKGGAKSGQFDGHAYSIVEGRAVVDFGLGNLRRGFRRDAPWAMAARWQPHGAVLATLVHPRAGRVLWRCDWQPPAGHDELRKARPLADELMQVYRDRAAVFAVAHS